MSGSSAVLSQGLPTLLDSNATMLLMVEQAFDDKAKVGISLRLAEVLATYTERPTRRALATAVARLASYETESGYQFRVEPPDDPRAIRLLVDLVEVIDYRVSEHHRVVVRALAEAATDEVMPRDIPSLANCIEGLGFGGHRVNQGTLRDVLIQTLRTRIERVARRILDEMIAAGYLESA